MSLSTFPVAELVFDRVDLQTGHIDEWELINELQSAIGDSAGLSEDHRRSAWATVEAFRFQRPSGDNRWPWGLYWCALSSRTVQDGREVFSPDIDSVDDNVLRFWAEHSVKAKHPAVRARFSDLAWEIGTWNGRKSESVGTADCLRPAVGQKIELAHIAIDSYLTLVNSDWLRDEYEGWQLLARAIELSAKVNDQSRLANAKSALFSFLGNKAIDGVGFEWWQFDEIAWTHRKQLTVDERAKAVELLERTVSEKSDFTDPQRFNPHHAKDATERLTRWGPNDDKERMQSFVRLAGGAFENAAKSGEALVAISWLEDLIPFYRSVGLGDDAARVEQAISSRAAQAESEFGQFEVAIDVPKDRIEKWIEDTAGETFDEGLQKIAVRCLIREQSSKDSIVNITRNSPLYAMIGLSVIGHDGFTKATVGSIADDLQGRAMQHAADLFSWNASWLNGAFNRLKEKHGVTAAMLTASFENRTMFADQQMSLVNEGLSAWFAGDSVKAIHVLVPQVEAILRNMLSKMGISVRKYEPKVRGFQSIGMGSLLHDDAMKTVGLRDVRFHFLALYADPRAINLRNQLAHGLARSESLSIGVANWVVHSLLVLQSIDLLAPVHKV